PLLDLVERVVEDACCRRFLAVVHEAIDELAGQQRPIAGIRGKLVVTGGSRFGTHRASSRFQVSRSKFEQANSHLELGTWNLRPRLLAFLLRSVFRTGLLAVADTLAV